MFRLTLLLGGFVLFSAFPRSANASPLVWYDEALQAVAVDAYAYGWGHDVEVDFNVDHLTAGLIAQNAWHFEYGNVTDFYVYELYPDGEYYSQVFGHGARLGELSAAHEFSTIVNALWDGSPTSDGFHFASPVWNVAAGNTVIYVRPAGPDGPLPVTPQMLADTFIRFDRGPWLRIADVPEDLTPVLVTVTVSPSKLTASSQGGFVTAHIELPSPHTVADLDLESVVLTVSSTSSDGGIAIARHNLTAKPTAVANERAKLVAKFDRARVSSLGEGEATVHLVGWLRDGRPVRGSTVLTVKPVY